MKKAALWLALLFCAGAFAGEASAKELHGTEAREYLGGYKERFTSGGYSYEILKRSHRDSMNGRASDAAIFTNATDKFYYKKRADSHHIIVLGQANGRAEDPVTTDAAVWNPIQNAISDDHPDAHVFLDDAGKEIAVVFTGRRTEVRARPASEGLLELEIKVTGSAKPISHRGR